MKNFTPTTEPPRGVKLRLVSLTLALVFGLFAWWQGNDPDSLGWILIYGYAAMVSVVAALGVRTTVAALAGAGAYTVLFIQSYPADVPWVIEEEAFREGLGLLICLVWMMALLAFELARLKNHRQQTT